MDFRYTFPRKGRLTQRIPYCRLGWIGGSVSTQWLGHTNNNNMYPSCTFLLSSVIKAFRNVVLVCKFNSEDLLPKFGYIFATMRSRITFVPGWIHNR